MPCTHLCAALPRRGVGGHADWPGFYRRSATGLAARGSGRAMPCTHFCAAIPRRGVGNMRVGRGFTAARRQALRLAGLAGSLVDWMPRLAEQSLLFSKTSQKIKKQGMLSEGLENIPCFIILPDVPKQFEGYASHEARCRMAACTRQPAGKRTRPASRGTCRATAVTHSQPAFPQAALRASGAQSGVQGHCPCLR